MEELYRMIEETIKATGYNGKISMDRISMKISATRLKTKNRVLIC